MFSVLLLIACIWFPVFLATRFLPRPYRPALAIKIVLTGIVFFGIVIFVDSTVPFTSGGDDLQYHKASQREFEDLGSWFDLRQFSRTHEQGGYPLMLSWVHQISGGSIFIRKALNVSLFLVLAAIWCGIGQVIGGSRLALAFANGMLLATPLWYYWMFLLKDMTVVVLQSLLLFGITYFLSANQRAKGYFWIAASTLLIIPFRSFLAVANMLFIFAASILSVRVGRGLAVRVGQLALAGTVVLGVFYLISRPELLASLGVATEARSLSAENLEQAAAFGQMKRPSYFYNPVMFTLVYLVGEVAAVNPQAWAGDTSTLLRAVSMLPWIFIGLPLFLMGSLNMFLRNRRSRTHGSTLVVSRDIQISRSYVLVFIGFILMYACIAWVAGDTTRWRMSSIPPLIAISVLGWLSMSRNSRINLLMAWSLLLSIALVVYYVVFK